MFGKFRVAVCVSFLRMADDQDAIFQLVLAGKTSREIGEILNLRRADVDQVIRAARDRLGVSTRFQAAALLAQPNGIPASAADGPWLADRLPVQNGCKSSIQHLKLNETKAEQTSVRRYGYGADAKENSSSPFIGKHDASVKGQFIKYFLQESPTLGRMLIMSIIVLGAVFGLSGLVSVMQGLDVLFRS